MLVLPSAGAESVRLQPVADTTLFESAPNDNLGGWTHFVAGTTGSQADRTRNRALLRFAIAGSLPAGATITSASLKLAVTRIPGTSGGGSAVNSTFALHRVLRSWGEGDKLGDRGAPADPGEATWNWRFAPADGWTTPGGEAGSDYVADPSATIGVTGLGADTIAGADTLVADVQLWLDQPGSNHGWLWLSQSEERAKTARAFGSREDAGQAPELEIEFSPGELRIDRVGRSGDTLELQFAARAGHGYAVEWTPQLPAAGWTPLTNFPPAIADRTVTATDPITERSRFYRLRRPRRRAQERPLGTQDERHCRPLPTLLV